LACFITSQKQSQKAKRQEKQEVFSSDLASVLQKLIVEEIFCQNKSHLSYFCKKSEYICFWA